jgi:peptidoglycan/LPS O-acetylase OafA/YrhL
MIFYALFPLIVRRVTSLPRSALFWLGSVALSALAFVVLHRLSPESGYNGRSFLSHLLYFATGIVAYFLYQQPIFHRPRVRAVLALALLGLCAVATYFVARTLARDPTSQAVLLFAHLGWSIPILLLLGVAVLTSASRFWAKPLTALGEWSFSIYLLHPLLLYFLTVWLQAHPHSSLDQATRFWLWLAASLAMLLTASWATFSLVESPGMSLGRRWTARPGRAGAAPAGG